MRTMNPRRLLFLSGVSFIAVSSLSCDLIFQLNDLGDVCQFFDQAQPRDETDADESLFEIPGIVAVVHGFGCADSRRDGREDIIKVSHSVQLPGYATSATVFLNGWKTKYLSKDHHVIGLGTFIRNISLVRQTLSWEAIGVLGDHNFDDSYEWCYHFTVIGWNPAALDLVVDHDDVSCEDVDSMDPAEANFFVTDDNSDSALAAFRSFLQNSGFADGNDVAILPRGFGFLYDGDDHHLLQLGLHADNSEVFVQGDVDYHKMLDTLKPLPESVPPSAVVSRVDQGFVSWETLALMEDNSTRDYRFAEAFSGLGGRDVGLIQPPFSLVPHDDEGFFHASLSDQPGVHTREFVVEEVPFEMAIPVLSGWELFYGDDDEHVTEAGTWIDEFRYDRSPGAPTGTLHYTLSSILRDQDDDPAHTANHKVTILGLRRLGPAVAGSARKPDLVPFSPLGAAPADFCRLEEQRKLLRVTVRNQGSGDAGPSRTTVNFSAGAFAMNTPAIPAGGSVDLLFKVPNDCFSPDCAFRIAVDSGSEVDEAQEGNNSVGGACVG